MESGKYSRDHIETRGTNDLDHQSRVRKYCYFVKVNIPHALILVNNTGKSQSYTRDEYKELIKDEQYEDFIKNGIIKTPPLNADILNVITRDSVIRLIRTKRIKLIEKNITIKELLNADEVFMTGTAAEVKSVSKINKTMIGNGKIGDITKILQKSFMDIVMGQDQKLASLLRYI